MYTINEVQGVADICDSKALNAFANIPFSTPVSFEQYADSIMYIVLKIVGIHRVTHCFPLVKLPVWPERCRRCLSTVTRG